MNQGQVLRDALPVLRMSKQGQRLPRDSDAVMAQVGWIGQSGYVYALDDPPRDAREPGSYSPLYIQIGVWENLGDGKYGIKD